MPLETYNEWEESMIQQTQFSLVGRGLGDVNKNKRDPSEGFITFGCRIGSTTSAESTLSREFFNKLYSLRD